MDFRLTDEQELLQQTAAEFFDRAATLSNARGVLDGTETLVDLRSELAKMEFLGLIAPTDRNGSGATMLDLAIVAEQAGKSLAQSCLSSTAARGVSLLVASDTVHADDVLQKVIAAETWLTVADGANLTLSPSGRLTGTTRPTMDAIDATTILALADAEGTPTVVAVEVGDSARIVIQKALDPTRAIARINFDDAPAETLLSGAAATSAWERSQNLAIIALAAEDLGTIGEAVQRAVAYAKDRWAFGRPIGSFQAVKHALVDVYVAEEQLRSLVWYAAWAADAEPEKLSLYAAAAGAYASEAVQKAAEMLIQVHGGIGFTWEHDAHLFWRRARVDRIFLGTAEQHKLRVSHELVA